MSRVRDIAEYLDRTPHCCFCGGAADAVWRSKRDLFVCRNCAVDVLAKLAADAITNRILQEPNRWDAISRYKVEFDMHFYRALAMGGFSDGQ